MKSKYKVGNKVRIKSLDWYNSNKDRYDEIDKGTFCFCKRMSEYCGKEFEVSYVCPDGDIRLTNSHWCWADWMFEEEVIMDDKQQQILKYIERIQQELHKLQALCNN